MSDGPLDDLQSHVRRLLDELDRITNIAGIPCWLAYGTALGAVRDSDLIPWDPDADVWIPSEHHPALVAACLVHLHPDFELLTAETHGDYEYLFPRLTVRGTDHVLLSLDVFPLDHAPRSRWGRRAYSFLARITRTAFLVRRGSDAFRVHRSPRRGRVAEALARVLRPLPSRVLIAVFRRLQRRRPSGVLVNSCGSYGSREYFDASWFASSHATPLGPVPIGYDELLTSLYGDWRVEPPPERVTEEIEHAVVDLAGPLREPGELLDPEAQDPPALGPRLG